MPIYSHQKSQSSEVIKYEFWRNLLDTYPPVKENRETNQSIREYKD